MNCVHRPPRTTDLKSTQNNGSVARPQQTLHSMDHLLSFCVSGLRAKKHTSTMAMARSKDILRYFVSGSNACCWELEAVAVTKRHKTKEARIVGMRCWSLQDPNKMVPAQSGRVDAMPMLHSTNQSRRINCRTTRPWPCKL